MGTSAKKLPTYEDILNLPETVVGELINGELQVSPRPSPKHSKAITNLGDEIVGPFAKGKGAGPGGWIILIEPEVHIQNDIFVPDLAGWKKEKLPSVPDDAFVSVVPDWVCEVISPSTAMFDRSKKMPLYGKQGVSFLWFIDPILKTLEVYKNQNGEWLFVSAYGGEDKIRAIPFDAIEIDLRYLWPEDK